MPPVEASLFSDGCGHRKVFKTTGLDSVPDEGMMIKLTAGSGVLLGACL